MLHLSITNSIYYPYIARTDRFNHDLNISGGGDDTDDTDDLPVFGSFGSYSPQYKKQNSSATQLNAIDNTTDDMFLLNDSMCTQSSTSSIGSFNSTKSNDSGAIPKIQTPQLRKLDVSINQL